MAFTVPGYLVDQLLGYGSNAEVWSARAATTAERVALKRFVLPSSLGDPRLAAQQAAGLARSARSEAVARASRAFSSSTIAGASMGAANSSRRRPRWYW